MAIERTIFSGPVELGTAIAVVALLIAPASGLVGLLWGRLRSEKQRSQRERRLRQELECYLRLDAGFASGADPSEAATRICEVVATCSSFHRVGLLLRDPEEQLYLAAYKGCDPEMVRSMMEWAEMQPEALPQGVRLGSRSVVLGMGDPAQRAVLVPLVGEQGEMLGSLVVMAASILEVRREQAEDAVFALEALALKLARAIGPAAMPNPPVVSLPLSCWQAESHAVSTIYG